MRIVLGSHHVSVILTLSALRKVDVLARLARVVAPGVATQRGNRRQAAFFCDDDYLVSFFLKEGVLSIISVADRRYLSIRACESFFSNSSNISLAR